MMQSLKGPSLVALALVARTAAGQAPVVQNLGYDSLSPTQHGSLVAFAVREAFQDGGTDLNGDQDAVDEVLFLHDAATGVTTNLGLAVIGPIEIDGPLVLFRVDEGQDGGVDYNMDGDLDDAILCVHDAASGVTSNIGLALPSFYEVDFDVLGQQVAFLVREQGPGSAQGVDLNGDGDVAPSDDVLFLWNAQTGTTTNVGFAAAATPYLEGDYVVFEAFELGQGLADLNGDGDVVDGVVHQHHIPTGVTTNVGLAGSISVFDQGRALLVADEISQGTGDLNGDGDASDRVVYSLDPISGGLTKLDLTVPATNVSSSEGNVHAAFLFDELSGSQDRNGDGDMGDYVVTLVDKASGALVNTGLAMNVWNGVPAPPPFVGGTLPVPVPETGQGAVDLNGDGDASDVVMHVHVAPTGQTRNVGLAVAPNADVVADKALAAFGVSEAAQGADLNADGDVIDVVAFVHFAGLGSTRNTGLAISPAGGRLAAGDGLVLILVHESSHGGTSLNGDSDLQDDVAHLFEARSGVVTNLGLAAQPGLISVAERLAVFSVPELGQGPTTLNADADTVDAIVHLAGPWL